MKNPRLVLAGALMLTTATSACDSGRRPESILLITIDTCRADRIGAYGAGRAATPTMDRLAEDGAVFLQATAPAPVTLPSHASVITGLYPDRHGVRDNGAGRLPDEAVTLAEILADEGWRTAAFLAAVPLDAVFGTDQGFDLYDDDFVEGDLGAEVITRLDSDQRVASEVLEPALPWIRDAARSGEPWFAWVHFFDPHAPYAPPADVTARHPGLSPYDAEIAAVDRAIAQLLAELEDETLVAVVADHGESLGDHGENTHGFFLYESVMRVPWILRGPGVPAGERVEDPVSIVAVMPTLLDAAGLPAPEGLDARSALPLARGEEEPEAVFAEAMFPRLNFGWAATRSVRVGSWKFIESPRPELFDLSTDPGETNNLAAERPDRVEDLRARLEDHFDRGGRLNAVPAGVTDEMLERLEGLGYVGAGGDADADEELWDFDRLDPRDGLGIFRELEQLPTVVLSGTEEEADAFIARLRSMDPGNVAILKKILKIRLRAQHWEKALAVADELVAALPDDLEVRRDQATAAMRSGDGARARESLRRVLELDPSDEIGRQYYSAVVNEEALTLSRTGRQPEAVAMLRESLPLLPDDVDTLNNLAWILADASLDPQAALEFAGQARALAPDDPVVLDTFGWAAIRAGRPDDAIEPLRRALEATRDAEVRAHLGLALLAGGRSEEGLAELKAAIRKRPELRELPETKRWLR